MRNKSIILLLFIININSIQAQTDSNYIVKPNWKKGEVKTLTQVLSRSSNIDSIDVFNKPDTVSFSTIKVLDVLNDGYVLAFKVRYKDKEIDSLAYIKEYLDKINFIIKVDTIGKFKELQNWRSLIDNYKELKKRIKNEAKKENKKYSSIKNLIKELNEISTKRSLIETCLFETTIFLSLYGEHLKLFDSISVPTIEPDKVIKEGIPLFKITDTKKIDEDRFSIKHSDIYDKTKTKILIDKYYPGVDLDSAVTTSYNFYIYNNKTSWVEKIIFYVQFQDTSWGYTNITTYTIE